jgi:hypothetical protein
MEYPLMALPPWSAALFVLQQNLSFPEVRERLSASKTDEVQSKG